MDSDIKKLAAAICKLADVHDRRLAEIGKAVDSLAHHTKHLGNGGAIGEMGALEHLSLQMGNGFSELSEAIRESGRNTPDGQQ
jgi:hypothetical protein